MKDFFKHVAATIVGIFGFGIIMGILGFISLLGMLCNSSKPSLKSNTVLVMKLNGEITDRTEENIWGKLKGDASTTLGMTDILSAIKKAEKEDKVKGIYLEMDGVQTDYATLEEIRHALDHFKRSGKWIIAYADNYTQGDYYLASIANKVFINPEGSIDWHGLAAQSQYLKDVATKFGVRFQVVKVGKYKSFTETYTEDKMSDANREQLDRCLKGTWKEILASVAKSRGISQDSLNHYADGLMAFDDTKKLKTCHMVDGFCYYDQIKKEVKAQLNIDIDRPIHQASISEINDIVADKHEGETIAVYYCQGNIVQTASSNNWGRVQEIVSTKVIKDLEALSDDDDVKAVVLRINSGGGDAYASEQIWRAVKELDRKKPVVVSMGGMTASGAYYMSMGARALYADRTTLTGSIGIFGVLPDLSELMTKKLGFKYDEVKTHANSGYTLAGTARPWSPTEVAAMQNMVNRGYALFRKRVADGRKTNVEEIEKLAQGRVWLGEDALGNKLIDRQGGLDAAIAYAAHLAKFDSDSDYHTEDYPAPASWMDQLINEATDAHSSYLSEQLQFTLGEYYKPFMWIHSIKERKPVQAALPYVIDIK